MARILLVDDDPSIRERLDLTLTQVGHSVVTAANGNEGLAKFRPGAFDLLITDLVMPEKEGIEMLRELHGRDPAMKAMAMSGGGKFGAAETYLRLASLLGARTILTKPFTREEFLATVNGVLAGGTPPPAKADGALGA